MKFENNWRQKSLENLEKEKWGEIPKEESSLVQRAYKLRKIPLEAFSIDDVRFMIGQRIGLKFLLPLALEFLKENLFVEANYYEGDLLNAVLTIKPENWKAEKEIWMELDSLIKNRLEEVQAHKPKLAFENFYQVKFE